MNSKDDEIEKLRRIVAELTAQLVGQTQRVAELMEQVGRQAQQIEELELKLAKAQKDSSTSSKPPSSDIVKPKPKHKKHRSRKKPRRGGQPGHEQHVREPLQPFLQPTYQSNSRLLTVII